MGCNRLTSGVCLRSRSSRRTGKHVADFPRLPAFSTAVLPSAAILHVVTVMLDLVGTEQVEQPPSAVVHCILAMVVWRPWLS